MNYEEARVVIGKVFIALIKLLGFSSSGVKLHVYPYRPQCGVKAVDVHNGKYRLEIYRHTAPHQITTRWLVNIIDSQYRQLGQAWMTGKELSHHIAHSPNDYEHVYECGEQVIKVEEETKTWWMAYVSEVQPEVYPTDLDAWQF